MPTAPAGRLVAMNAECETGPRRYHAQNPSGPCRPLPRYLEPSLRRTSFNGRVPARFLSKDEFMDLLIRLRVGPPRGRSTATPASRFGTLRAVATGPIQRRADGVVAMNAE